MITSWKPTGKIYKGNGEIRDKNQFLAKVEYSLNEEQEYNQIEEMGTRQDPKQLGRKRLKGSIVVEGDEDLSGLVTLFLAQDRSIPIVIESYQGSSMYNVREALA